MGILLIGDGGLSAEQALKLRWKNLVSDPEDFDHVTVLLHKNDSAGYTHNYSHPLFPYAGHFLHQRFDLLVSQFGLETALDMPIVSHADDARKPLSPSTFAAFCKQHLRLVFARSKSPMKPDHAAVQFLLNDYAHRLSHICGLSADPSAVRYLRGLSLSNDVTADSYRGFSGEDGQRYLYQYLRRKRDFDSIFKELPEDATPNYTVEETADGTMLRISGIPGKLTNVNLKLEVKEETAKSIILSGENGIELESAICRKE